MTFRPKSYFSSVCGWFSLGIQLQAFPDRKILQVAEQSLGSAEHPQFPLTIIGEARALSTVVNPAPKLHPFSPRGWLIVKSFSGACPAIENMHFPTVLGRSYRHLDIHYGGFRAEIIPTHKQQDGVWQVSIFPMIEKDKIQCVHFMLFLQLWDNCLRRAF